MRIWILFLVFSTCRFAEALSPRGASLEETQFSRSVGVKTLQWIDEKRSRPIVVEFWYPIDRSQKGSDELREAPLPKSERLPLIVMSHGFRGSRLGQSWLAHCLARQGYFVASVEHYGNTKENFYPLLSLKFWERPKDVSFALDHLLEEFRGAVDPDRIGFIGYSLGGMTGLGLAGAQAKNVREIVLRENQNQRGFTNEVVLQVDFSEGEKLYADPRIKAMLLLCPANFFYPPESLKKIKTPMGLVAIVHDEILPHKEHAYPLIRHLMPQKVKVLREKVSHNFLSPSADKPPHEARLHREIASFALDFFKSNF